MKNLLLILMISVPGYLFCQDPIKSQDPSAEPYLENIASSLNANSPYQVEFKYEIYSAMEDATVSDFGSIIVKDKKYKLKTEDMEVLYNGRYLWVHNLQAAEVYQSEPSEGDTDQMLADPFRLMGNFRNNYKYLYKGDQKINGTTYAEIDLYPAEIESGYSIIRILCNEGGNNIHSITLRQKNGTEITAFINEIIRNISVPDSVFSWNAETKPDVLLIEM